MSVGDGFGMPRNGSVVDSPPVAGSRPRRQRDGRRWGAVDWERIFGQWYHLLGQMPASVRRSSRVQQAAEPVRGRLPETATTPAVPDSAIIRAVQAASPAGITASQLAVELGAEPEEIGEICDWLTTEQPPIIAESGARGRTVFIPASQLKVGCSSHTEPWM